MSENKNNIVDAQVETLDLEELKEAVGGAGSVLPLVLPEFDVESVRQAIGRGRGNTVLIENDGWQGN